MKKLSILILTLLLVCCAKENEAPNTMNDATDVHDKSVVTSVGEVITTQGKVEAVVQKIRLLSAKERQYVSKQTETPVLLCY